MKNLVKSSCLITPPPYSDKGFQDLTNKKFNKRAAFTLPEALIVIAIIGIIATMLMSHLNNGKLKQRELLSRFDGIFSQLNDITQMSAAMSKNYSNWSSEFGSLKNLSCTDSSGREVENKSQCLKTAFMSQSGKITDVSSPADVFTNYTKLQLQLLAIFPNLNTSDIVAFKLHGSAYVLGAYIDSSCSTDIPVYQNADGEVEYVKGCGFLLTDVNGKEKPNNLLVNEDKTIDQFLMAITKDGLVKSNYLNGLAQCPDGTRWNAAQGACVESPQCPYNMDEMKARESANDASLIVKELYNNNAEECYQIRCASGDRFDSLNQCPTNCEQEGQKHAGGLWLSEGGDLPEEWDSKACCVPVSTQGDLDNIRNNANKNHCLMNDIEFDRTGAGSTEETGWTPINNFSATFYGNGHRIKGIYINQNFAALFKNLSGTVENLEVNGSGNADEADMTCSYCAAISYQSENNSKIQNVVNSANFGGSSSAGISSYGAPQITNAINLGNFNDSGGGISSSNGTPTITNAINLGNFNDSGGGISYGSSTIINAINLGNFNDRSGGISSTGSSTITKAINWGNFNDSGGGISYGSSTIINAINLGNFNDTFSGGISSNGPSTITNAINLGNFNGPFSGWISYTYSSSFTITNTINLGNFNGNSGSISFAHINNFTITNAYNLAPESTKLPIFASLSKTTDTTSSTTSLSNAFYLTNSIAGCTTKGNFEGCTEILEANVKKAATYSAIANDPENAQYWSIVDGYYPTLKASVMPPQIFRDCRNDANPYGGCYDVLNTPNAFMPDYRAFLTTQILNDEEKLPYIMWAWKKPTNQNPKVEAPVLRWQCKPYRTNGYDCCRPSYATWEPKLPDCPALDPKKYENYRPTN